LGVPLHEDVYDPKGWIDLTRKFKDEPEKGRRCDVCYAARLLRTAEKAAGEGFEAFATVMSLSPWKKAATLNRIGRQFGARFGIRFLEADFKKKDGFRKSIELGKKLGLYRQDYWGCLYSLEARDRRRPAPRR
jgi:predicted adenine nucleotide alpha hydrolase (AANH) superfamily ATPase